MHLDLFLLGVTTLSTTTTNIFPRTEACGNCPGPNEIFDDCGTSCRHVCGEEPDDIYVDLCTKGCFCIEGYCRDENERCKRLNDEDVYGSSPSFGVTRQDEKKNKSK